VAPDYRCDGSGSEEENLRVQRISWRPTTRPFCGRALLRSIRLSLTARVSLELLCLLFLVELSDFLTAFLVRISLLARDLRLATVFAAVLPAVEDLVPGDGLLADALTESALPYESRLDFRVALVEPIVRARLCQV